MSLSLRTVLIVWLSVVGVALNGCANRDNSPTSPRQQTWTISGKTYLVGSKDPIGGVVLKCSGINTVSGSDGSYQLSGIPSGTQTLTAEFPMAQPYSSSVEVTSDLTYFVFVMLKFTNLSGYVTNAVDGPVDSAKVMLDNSVAQTDISGHYSFSRVPQGDYTLTVTHPDYLQFQIRITLDVLDSSYDVVLKRELSVEGQVSAYKYIDQSMAAWSLPVGTDNQRVFLRANGYDDLGVYHDGIEQDILLSIVFPRLLADSHVALIDGSVQLFADSLPVAFGIKAFPIKSSWTLAVSFLTQPVLGPILYSGTIGQNPSGGYVNVVGLDGLNQLLANYRGQGVVYGVEIKGGTITSTSFYSSYALKNQARLLLKVRY